jgi:hypothetical protein
MGQHFALAEGYRAAAKAGEVAFGEEDEFA